MHLQYQFNCEINLDILHLEKNYLVFLLFYYEKDLFLIISYSILSNFKIQIFHFFKDTIHLIKFFK